MSLVTRLETQNILIRFMSKLELDLTRSFELKTRYYLLSLMVADENIICHLFYMSPPLPHKTTISVRMYREYQEQCLQLKTLFTIFNLKIPQVMDTIIFYIACLKSDHKTFADCLSSDMTYSRYVLETTYSSNL